MQDIKENISDTQAKILQAAKTVFTRKGYDGASMQAIAREAGINKALLHYYCRSKDNLFDIPKSLYLISFVYLLTNTSHSLAKTHLYRFLFFRS